MRDISHSPLIQYSVYVDVHTSNDIETSFSSNEGIRCVLDHFVAKHLSLPEYLKSNWFQVADMVFHDRL